MSCTVLIPTYNSFATKQGSLELTLLSLARQSISENLEVIIVDNGSNDRTDEYLVNSVPEILKPRLEVLHCPETGNRSKARNAGIAVASEERIVFLDDDVIFQDRDTLERALRVAKSGSFACGAKRYWMVRHWNPSAIKAELQGGAPYIEANSFLPRGISRETGYRDLQEFTFVAHFGVVERSALGEYGGFDETRFPTRREDVELMFRLLRAGMTYSHLFETCRCVHLTHPIVASTLDERLQYHQRFRDHEALVGMRFRVGALFGVYEGLSGQQPLETIV